MNNLWQRYEDSDMAKNTAETRRKQEYYKNVHSLHVGCIMKNHDENVNSIYIKQESPAVADKPARSESMPKIAPIRRAYNVVADNTGLSSFVWLLLRPNSEICEIQIQAYRVQGHRRSSIMVPIESAYVLSYIS